MITINRKYIQQNGGVLKSISKKSSSYLRELLYQKRALKRLSVDLKKLDRTIVHAYPHLDEYFADLLLRSCLPEHKMGIDFMELSIQSRTNDSTCKAYFPNAIVLGIGSTVSGGAKALKIYDEHLNHGKRGDVSCSELVKKDVLKERIPWSIYKILNEVNEIDSSGGAHPQHIGNILKIGHSARFMYKKGKEFHQSKQGWLTPQWKKTLMDASITAVIYCLQNKIDLRLYNEENKQFLTESFTLYSSNSPFKNDRFFTPTIHHLKNIYFNQTVHYKTAKLPNSKTPQLLIISRVCYALYKCWGEKIAQIIMLHFWEMLYQGQASFLDIQSELKGLTSNANDIVIQSKYGKIYRKLLSLNNSYNNENFWLIEIDQTPRMLMGNRPVIHYLNTKNNGYGLIFINDKFQCTKALFKGSSMPDTLWEKLVNRLCQKEPSYWHVTEGASFLINGNRSHQYVPFSQTEVEDIVEILKDK